MVIALAACSSTHPAPTTRPANEWEPWASDCSTKEAFVEARDSSLAGEIVDCMTGEKIQGLRVIATDAQSRLAEATSDATGRYRLQLSEGRYHVTAFLDVEDGAYDLDLGEIEIRVERTTVKDIRLDFARCPPALGRPSAASDEERDALVAAVLDHHAAAGIVDARRPGPGPTYVTIRGVTTLALPPGNARKYIVTTRDDLQREAEQSGQEIWFLDIGHFEIAGSCATVSAGGDFVEPERHGRLCCCSETEVFFRHAGHWAFRTSRVGVCI